MNNTYRMRFIAPSGYGTDEPVSYLIEIESSQPIAPQYIRRAVASAKGLGTPDEIADSLAQDLPGKQTITSWHDSVQVITTRGTAK